MKLRSIRFPSAIAVVVAILFPFCWGSTSVAGDRPHSSPENGRLGDKLVLLQIRIAEAKRHRDVLRCYKSLMRQRKGTASTRQSPPFGVTDGSSARPSH